MKGILLGQFEYPTMGGNTGKFELRVIPGVLDAHFNEITRDYAGRNTANELEHSILCICQSKAQMENGGLTIILEQIMRILIHRYLILPNRRLIGEIFMLLVHSFNGDDWLMVMN